MYQSIILALLATCACAYEVKNPDVSLRQDGGIKFATADEPEISLVAYHYSVNKPVPNVAAGDYNVDVNSPTAGYWVHENPSVVVVPGDIVNYWVHVITTSGTGHNLLEQSWTATAATQAPPTVATTTTVAATTSIVSPTTTLQTPVVTTIQSTASTGTTATTTQGSTTVTVPPGAGTLIFEDTFDTFDLDVWEHEMTAGGGGNWEFQYYTNNRSNSYVRDNTLYIKPTLTSEKEGEAFLTSGTLNLWGASPADLCTGNNWWGCERTGSFNNILNPIQSARLRTVNSFAFKHGRIEVFAQLPKGDWLWPAIWLLPKRNAYGGWPASGEIDLVESRGNRNLRAADGTHVGAEQVGMTLHWGPYWPLNGYPMTHNAKNLPDGQTFGDGFHNYTLVWTADSLDFYLDGEPILSVDPGASGFFDYGGFEASNPGIQNPWANSPNKLAPFDQEFYIILNVAVGGTGYFSDSFTNSPNPKPWLNTSPTAAKDFYDAKADWYPTWNPDTNNGEDAAMKIKSVRVYAL